MDCLELNYLIIDVVTQDSEALFTFPQNLSFLVFSWGILIALSSSSPILSSVEPTGIHNWFFNFSNRIFQLLHFHLFLKWFPLLCWSSASAYSLTVYFLYFSELHFLGVIYNIYSVSLLKQWEKWAIQSQFSVTTSSPCMWSIISWLSACVVCITDSWTLQKPRCKRPSFLPLLPLHLCPAVGLVGGSHARIQLWVCFPLGCPPRIPAVPAAFEGLPEAVELGDQAMIWAEIALTLGARSFCCSFASSDLPFPTCTCSAALGSAGEACATSPCADIIWGFFGTTGFLLCLEMVRDDLVCQHRVFLKYNI